MLLFVDLITWVGEISAYLFEGTIKGKCFYKQNTAYSPPEKHFMQKPKTLGIIVNLESII